MRAVHVLAHDSGPLVEAGVEHNPVPFGEAIDAFAEPDDRPGAVGPEDPRLRRGGKPAAQPDVEVVERGCPEADQNLAGPGLRVGSVLEAQDLRPAVLVDADRLHGAIVSSWNSLYPETSSEGATLRAR